MGGAHSSWRSSWDQENWCGRERYPCDGSLAPWSEPEWASRPDSSVHECSGACAQGQCSIHAFRKRSQRQSQAEGQDLVLVSLPSKGKPKELPVSLNDPGCENTHPSGRWWQTSPPPGPETWWFLSSASWTSLCRGKNSNAVDPEWVSGRRPPSAEEPSFDVRLRYFLYRSFL